TSRAAKGSFDNHEGLSRKWGLYFVAVVWHSAWPLVSAQKRIWETNLHSRSAASLGTVALPEWRLGCRIELVQVGCGLHPRFKRFACGNRERMPSGSTSLLRRYFALQNELNSS